MRPGSSTCSAACAATSRRSSAELQGAEATLRDAQVSVIAEVARTYFELRGQQSELVGRAPQRREPEGDARAHPGAPRRRQRHRAGHLARAVAAVSTTLATIGPLEAAHRPLHPPPERAHRARARTRSTELLQPAHELPELPRIDRRWATRRGCCAAGPTSASPSASWPPPPRSSAWRSATSSPRSPSPAASATPPPEVGGLGESSSRGYVIGPGISWAAFDLGRVRAQVAGSRARADVALAGYEQTRAQGAGGDRGCARDPRADTRSSLKDATDAAQASATAARIARTRYEGGLVDFLDVLDAERTELAAEDRLAQSPHRGGHQPGGGLQGAGRWLGGRPTAALRARDRELSP